MLWDRPASPGGKWTYPLGGRSRCACIRDQSDEWPTGITTGIVDSWRVLGVSFLAQAVEHMS